MNHSELFAHIEQTAPLHLAAPWDKSGLQVASGRQKVQHLAVCLDPTVHNILQAIQLGADMLLSHHPLTLAPRFADTLDEYHECLRLLLTERMALYAAHTSLDANPAGPAAWLARDLHLEECSVLDPLGSWSFAGLPALECGIGCVGSLPTPLNSATFIHRIRKDALPAHSRLCGPDLPPLIRRVAICPGSGASLAQAARTLGADVLITGDVRYHTALESPVALLDAGHHVLEEEMMRRYAAELLQQLGIEVSFIASRDPMRVLPS